MCPLEIDSFAGGIRRNQDFGLLALRETLLRLATVFAQHAAADRDDGFRLAEQCSDSLREIVERVAMLGEDHEFSTVPVLVEHVFVVL